jgi:hypothetical protein
MFNSEAYNFDYHIKNIDHIEKGIESFDGINLGLRQCFFVNHEINDDNNSIRQDYSQYKNIPIVALSDFLNFQVLVHKIPKVFPDQSGSIIYSGQLLH